MLMRFTAILLNEREVTPYPMFMPHERYMIEIMQVEFSLLRQRRLPARHHDPSGSPRLEISHHLHESFVLVVLMMTMKQRRARVVGDDINLDAAEPRHVDRSLHVHPRLVVVKSCRS